MPGNPSRPQTSSHVFTRRDSRPTRLTPAEGLICSMLRGTLLMAAMLLDARSAMSAAPTTPLTKTELAAMSVEQLNRHFCLDQQLAKDLAIETEKYGGLLLKDHPSPIYQRSYQAAAQRLKQVQEEERRIARVLMDREEALPSCMADR